MWEDYSDRVPWCIIWAYWSVRAPHDQFGQICPGVPPGGLVEQIALELPLVANFCRLAWEHPLVADFGILVCECPMVADLGRLALERPLAADLIRLPWSPSGGQFGQVGPALMATCYDKNSLPWYSMYINKWRIPASLGYRD